MAPHIVSWGANAPAASPVSSTSPSVVSFDSIPSDIQPRKVPETAAETGTDTLNSSTGEPSAIYPGIDDSFQRHGAYFFKDGNITFLVDGTLYCVHRFFFSRDSVYFSTRLAQLGTRDHEALATIVSLGDVECEDFDALLSVIYPKDFEEHNLSYQQWKSVLHLSTRWGFASIRKLALKFINPPTPHDRLMLARTYAVDQWVVPALTALCERADPLTLTEARQMLIEDVVLVAAVREDVRGRVLRLDAKVTRIVESALDGKLPLNEGNSAPRACIEGGPAKQGASSTAADSPVDSEREVVTQDSGSSYFTQWPGKGVAKSPEENAIPGVGSATQPEQAAPKPDGERDPKPLEGRFEAAAQAAVDSVFSTLAGKVILSKQRPLQRPLPVRHGSKGQSSSASVEKPSEKPSTSTPTQKIFPFSFSQGSAATASSSVGTLLRPVESDSPSAEKKPRTSEDNPADSKAPVTRK